MFKVMRPAFFGAPIRRRSQAMAGLFAALLTLLWASTVATAYDQNFLLKPYLQLGYDGQKDPSALDVVWFSEEAKHKWQVEYTTAKSKSDKGISAESITERMISLPGFSAPYYKLTARLNKLPAGETFTYKVLKDGHEVFTASGKAKKGPSQAFRVALFGDCGINGEGQRKLAKHVAASQPDLVVIPGDIAYQQGLFSQYLSNFFPIYNQDPAKPEKDAAGEVENKTAATIDSADSIASMRSTIWAGVIGNHDISLSGYSGTNINRYPDALAYFLFWNEPLNGFKANKKTETKNIAFMSGDPNRQEMFKKSAGDAYPVMNNYSFDFGDAHFVALDGNYYMDWNDPQLRSWLADDLKAAQDKSWRILVMHQPGFLIGAPHDNEQKMRLITDIAAKFNVNMVIAGHSHCFERSAPFTFTAKDTKDTFVTGKNETVPGTFTLDKDFDGVKNTKPKGIIYVVSGAGGAHLYKIDAKAINEPDSYMKKWDYSTHSFSSLDIDSKSITFKQITEDGKVIDQFLVTK